MSAARAANDGVSLAAFTARLKALGSGPHVAVAFSGGPDSLALLILAAQWAARSDKRSVLALTVDHGLRAESASEARLCARLAKSLHVRHRVLHWKGAKPQAGIQAAAREARYRLLNAACEAEGIDALLVAHHLDDQAETFLLRLARGSGVDGLAGMAPSRALLSGEGAGQVRLLRPLLDVPQQVLRKLVAQSGLTPIDDPSNGNMRFDRVKVRNLIGDLASIGLTPRRLADTAAHMARARQAIEGATRHVLHRAAAYQPLGYIEADPQALCDAPDEISLRALSAMLKQVGARAYPPRFEALSGLYDALKGGQLDKGRTLLGCKLLLRDGRLFVFREVSAALAAPAQTLRKGHPVVWDGRFRLTLASAPREAGPLQVRALGPEGARLALSLGGIVPDGPKAAFASLPAIWAGEKLVAAPHFGALDGPFAGRLRVEAGLCASDYFLSQ